MCNGSLDRGCWAECSWLLLVSLSFPRKVEDLQFRVEEESITKGDLEVIPYDLAKMWGPKLHVGPHLSNLCLLLLPSNNTLLVALDLLWAPWCKLWGLFFGVVPSDCSHLELPGVNLSLWVAKPRENLYLNVLKHMFFHSRNELTVQFLSLLWAANGHVESPDWMYLIPAKMLCMLRCPHVEFMPMSVGLTLGWTPCPWGGLLLRVMLLQWTLCKLEVMLGWRDVGPWVGGFSMGKKDFLLLLWKQGSAL